VPITQRSKGLAEARFATANGPVAEPWQKPLKCRQFLGYGAAQESNLPSVGLPRLTGFEAS
jgi:hypothetical protein